MPPHAFDLPQGDLRGVFCEIGEGTLIDHDGYARPTMISKRPGKRATRVYSVPGQPQMRKGLPDGNPLKMLVRLERLELPAPWFVAKYSIQLSYSRMTGIITELLFLRDNVRFRGSEPHLRCKPAGLGRLMP